MRGEEQWRTKSIYIKTKIYDMIDQYTTELREAERELSELKDGSFSLNELTYNVSIRENEALWNANKARRKLLTRINDLNVTLLLLDRIKARKTNFRTESGDEGETGAVTSSLITTTENVGDIFGTDPNVQSVGTSHAPDSGQSATLKIQNFMDRPISLASGTMAVGSQTLLSFDVWDLITLQPSVRAKFKNHAHFRGDLHLRLVVAGSPFHYGRILASYQPHSNKNANIIAHATNYSTNPLTLNCYLAYLSQAPGATIIDVRQNRPVEMVIPYISPKPKLRLFNASSSAISAATSFEDFEDMGKLFFYTLNPIGSTSSGTSSAIAYQILGWLTNVELSDPTATNMEITTESRDERRSGPVERMSSAGAVVAGALQKVPFLAPFATPAKLILSGLSSVASWFGWSRPINLNNAEFVKNRPYTNTSTCIGMETVDKLSYDPQMQLAVDGHACGSATDDMVLANICSREGYVETFTWAHDDTPHDPLLLLMVHPQINTYYEEAKVNEIVQPSPLSFVASHFGFWRGDITYRLDFVTSKFHRGKFAIWYEPNHYQSTLISADLALNKNFVQIIDLEQTNSIEFTVKWANSYPWLRTISPSLVKSYHNAGSALVTLPQYINGFICLAPFTALQSPDDSDIEVNIFVKSDNIVFNVLSYTNLPTTRKYATESRDESLNEVPVTRVDLNESSASLTNCADYHFGEIPLSFRTLMKRYVTTKATSKTATGAYSRMYITTDIVPAIDGAYGASSASSYNQTLWSSLRYAFLGIRGCVRKKIRMIESTGAGPMGAASVSLGAIGTTSSATTTHDTSSVRPWLRGTVAGVPFTNGGIEVELPWYNPNLFLFSFATDMVGTIATGEVQNAWNLAYIFDVDAVGTTNDVRRFTEDTASGEDFTLMRFSGAPNYSYAL